MSTLSSFLRYANNFRVPKGDNQHIYHFHFLYQLA